MGRNISTYWSNDGSKAEVNFDFKDELAYIEYYDDNGKLFFTEEFLNKSIRYVEDAAENWAEGIKILELKNG